MVKADIKKQIKLFRFDKNVSFPVSFSVTKYRMILLIAPDTAGHVNTMRVLKTLLDKAYPYYKTILHLLDYTDLKSSDPKVFIFQKYQANLQEIVQTYDMTKVNLIIYDFFAIEGYFLGKQFQVPYICNVPAVMGPRYFEPMVNETQLKSMFASHTQHVDLKRVKNISDGIILEGSHQLVWNYQGLHETKLQGLPNYTFVGASVQFTHPPPPQSHSPLSHSGQDPQPSRMRQVYLSFGTVVPKSLYQKHEKGRAFIIKLYITIIQFVQRLPYTRLIVSLPIELQAEVRPAINSTRMMIPSVQFVTYADQCKVLQEADLFITHGGGNSFQEALYFNCPLLVIPFFGDQHQVATYVNQHNVGIGLEYGSGVETSQVENLYKLVDLARICSSIRQLLTKPPPLANFQKLLSPETSDSESETNLAKILRVCDRFLPKFPTSFKPGDLLFGTNEDRLHLVHHYTLQDHFQIGTTRPFKTLDELPISIPTLIDQWNDLLRKYTTVELMQIASLKNILEKLLRYKEFIQLELKIAHKNEVLHATDKQVLHLCCLGLHFFFKENHIIHFTFANYSSLHNPGTRSEIKYLVQLLKRYPQFKSQIRLWRFLPQYRTYVLKPLHILTGPALVSIVRDRKTIVDVHTRVKQSIQSILADEPTTYWFQDRVKDVKSIAEKVSQRHLEVTDLYDRCGFRIIYPWAASLHALASKIETKLNIAQKYVKERGKVIYLLGQLDNTWYEIQFWPTILYHCFESEHATVYKATPSAEKLEQSRKLREKEHTLQNHIDDHVLIKFH